MPRHDHTPCLVTPPAIADKVEFSPSDTLRQPVTLCRRDWPVWLTEDRLNARQAEDKQEDYTRQQRLAAQMKRRWTEAMAKRRWGDIS